MKRKEKERKGKKRKETAVPLSQSDHERTIRKAQKDFQKNKIR